MKSGASLNKLLHFYSPISNHRKDTAMRRSLLTLMLASAMGLAAPMASAQSAAPLKVTLGGGSVGGAWSAIGTAIGEALKRQYPGTSFTYEPSREQANILLVSQGKYDLGIAHAQLARRAASGADPFKEPITNVRAIAQIDPEATVQILVRDGSGIKSFEQIAADKKPVRVVFNQRGTMMALAGEQVLEAYGISPKDIEKWGGKVFYVSYNDGLDMMKKDQADVIINMLAFPSGQITSATREMPVHMLSLSPAAVTKVDASLGTKPAEIPGKTYGFQPQAVSTVTGRVVLLANASMSDEEADRIVTAMLKQFEFLQKSHATLGRLSKTSLADVAPLKLHPGAEKAYRAAGLLK